LLVGDVEIDQPLGGRQIIGIDLDRFLEGFAGFGRLLLVGQNSCHQEPRLRSGRKKLRHPSVDPQCGLPLLLRQIGACQEVIRLCRLRPVPQHLLKRTDRGRGATSGNFQLRVQQHWLFETRIDVDRLAQPALGCVRGGAHWPGFGPSPSAEAQLQAGNEPADFADRCC
jgi:hypothetical protein